MMSGIQHTMSYEPLDRPIRGQRISQEEEHSHRKAGPDPSPLMNSQFVYLAALYRTFRNDTAFASLGPWAVRD